MAQNQEENQRAQRIYFIINACHLSLDEIYELLVDRDFDSVERHVKEVIVELKLLLRSIEDDDF